MFENTLSPHWWSKNKAIDYQRTKDYAHHSTPTPTEQSPPKTGLVFTNHKTRLGWMKPTAENPWTQCTTNGCPIQTYQRTRLRAGMPWLWTGGWFQLAGCQTHGHVFCSAHRRFLLGLVQGTENSRKVCRYFIKNAGNMTCNWERGSSSCQTCASCDTFTRIKCKYRYVFAACGTFWHIA